LLDVVVAQAVARAHEDIARDRARPDLVDAIVSTQTIAQPQGQGGLASESRDVQAGATAHRSGKDDDARQIPIGTHR
jgi:hypothetical protein